jgi:superfamily II DNA helicase RecQ
MQLKVFAIGAQGGDEAAEELNKFLRGQRVLAVERRLIEQPGGAYWTFCVEYLERGGESGGSGAADRTRRGVDYKEVLNEADFVVFAKLRDLRKSVAEKEGVPAYSVFTNEQLAAMVTGRVDSQAALGKIDGVGSARLEKYGAAFVDALKVAMAAQPAAAMAANQGKDGSA